MKQYKQALRDVLELGTRETNRTGVDTIMLPGLMTRYDMREGFPATTLKKLAFKGAMGELVGFLRGENSAQAFRDLGCGVWDQNANENKDWLANPYREGPDSMGSAYGVVWTRFPAYKVISLSRPNAAAQIAHAKASGYAQIGQIVENDAGVPTDSVVLYKAIDQLRQCLDTIMKDPGNRRNLFHGWNWPQVDSACLPSCHLLYQFVCSPSTKEISVSVYIRSNDLGLGHPWNAAEAAALLALVGRLSGYSPKFVTLFIGDAHCYVNHLDMVNQMLEREPMPPPKLVISERVPEYAVTGLYEPEWLSKVEPNDFSLEGYEHHPAISAPMAV